MTQFPTSCEAIREALTRIRSKVHLTPVMTCNYIDKLAGKTLFFKCEHLQKTGSFKVRGALNATMSLLEKNPQAVGVVTHSSGNHGQAVAWAAAEMGLPCTVVVPETTPEVKINSIKKFGAHLVKCKPTPTDRVKTCQSIADETGYVIIPSCDHPDVLAGQGTAGIELLEQVHDLDALLISVSGGGLASGIAIAAKAIKPTIKIYLVSPEGKMLEECLRAKQRLWPAVPKFLDTIAEGIMIQQCGQLTFPILCELAEKDAIEVSDEEMIAAMKLVFHHMKQVIEASAGAAVAAALKFKFAEDIQRIGVYLCGGNVDVNRLPWY